MGSMKSRKKQLLQRKLPPTPKTNNKANRKGKKQSFGLNKMINQHHRKTKYKITPKTRSTTSTQHNFAKKNKLRDKEKEIINELKQKLSAGSIHFNGLRKTDVPQFCHQWRSGIFFEAATDIIVLNVSDNVTNKKWTKRVNKNDLSVQKETMRAQYYKIGKMLKNGTSKYEEMENGNCRIIISNDNEKFQFILKNDKKTQPQHIASIHSLPFKFNNGRVRG